jgi:ATP-dependent DNA ligase
VDEYHVAGQRVDLTGIDLGCGDRVQDMTRSLAGGRRAEATALPSWIKPQLTKLVDEPLEGPEWLHEIKFDG